MLLRPGALRNYAACHRIVRVCCMPHATILTPVSAWCNTCPDSYILVRYLWSLTCKRRSELFHSASAVNTCKAIFSTPHGASSLSWNGSCGKTSWNGIPKPLPKSTNIIQYHSHSFYLILILIIFSAKTSWNFHHLTSSAHISLDLRASTNQATPHRLLCPAGGCQGRSDHPQQRGSHIERWPATGRGGEVCLFLFRQRQEQKGFGVQTIGHLYITHPKDHCAQPSPQGNNLHVHTDLKAENILNSRNSARTRNPAHCELGGCHLHLLPPGISRSLVGTKLREPLLHSVHRSAKTNYLSRGTIHVHSCKLENESQMQAVIFLSNQREIKTDQHEINTFKPVQTSSNQFTGPGTIPCRPAPSHLADTGDMAPQEQCWLSKVQDDSIGAQVQTLPGQTFGPFRILSDLFWILHILHILLSLFWKSVSFHLHTISPQSAII